MDFAEVEEVVDALNFWQFPVRVEENHKTEADHQKGVTEEPKYLERSLFVRISWLDENLHLFNFCGKPVLNMVRKGSTKK